MKQPANVMEIFKHLDKSNCRECGEKSCLAFAGSVFQAKKKISQCPRIDSETAKIFAGNTSSHFPPDHDDESINKLRLSLKQLDLAEAAKRTGGQIRNSRLVIPILGKPFALDQRGTFYTDLHIIPWLSKPLLEYVISSKGIPPANDWVPYRELKESKTFTSSFFEKRCEAVIKHIADSYTELFDDMVHLFNGKTTEAQFQSDISVVLYPLPLVPMMICYWKADEGMDSSLHLFFDTSVDENLPEGAFFFLTVGFAAMLEKLCRYHGTQSAK